MIGLPRRIPSAAVQLSAWHTSNQDALDAAYWSAYHADRAAFFIAEKEDGTEAESTGSSLQANQLK